MTADVYVYHSGQPGIPQLSGAGGAGQLDALLYAIGVTGFGAVTLDSLTRSGTVATATRAAGLNLADGIAGMPHIIAISGSTNGWDGEYTLNAVPGSTICTFNVPDTLATPATGTLTLKRAPAGMTRIASAGNKSVYQFKDPLVMPGYFMLDDSNSQQAGVRLAETAANPADYSTMTGLCPTAAQIGGAGLVWKKTNGGSTNKQFVIVVDRGGIYVFIAWDYQRPGLDAGYAGRCISLRAADGFPGIVIGNTQSPTYPSDYQHFMLKNGGMQAGQFLQRTYSQSISGAIQFTKAGCGLGTRIGEAAGAIDPNPVDNANHLVGPIYIFEGQTTAGSPLRGFLPGIWDPINAANRSTLDVIQNITGLPGRSVLIVKSPYATQFGALGLPVGVDITGPW